MMKSVLARILISGILCLLFNPCVFGFDIVKDGKAKACIFLPGTPSQNTVQAAQLFAEHIYLFTNVRLAIHRKSVKGEGRSLNQILIREDARPGNSKSEGEVTFPSKGVMQISGSAEGLRRLLPLVLEKYAGFVFVWPSPSGLHFPEGKKSFSIPEKTVKYEPFFNLERSLSNGFAPYLNLLGLKWMIDCQHQLPYYILPIKEYIASGKWPDKEIFPLINGKRVDMAREHKKFAPTYQSDFQPCHMSEKAVEEAVKNIEKHLQKHPHTRSISLSPNDNRGYCLCKKCTDFNQKRSKKAFRMFGPAFRYKDHSRSYFYWCNKVAERIHKKYPHIFFGTLAYRETHIAPDFKLHPRLTVFLCFDIGTTQYPQIHKKLVSWVEEWEKTGAVLGVWEYGFGDSYYTLPRVSFRQQGKLFRFMADKGFRAMFVEGAESLGDGPKRYLYLKLAENPYMDVEKLLAEWYTACVGAKGAVYLKEYYDFWEKFWEKKASRTAFAESRSAIYHTMTPFGPYMNGLEKGDMAYLRTLMEKMLGAANAAGTKAQKLRAQLLMKAFTYIECGAKASFGEILTNAGTIKDARHALELLRYSPIAEKAMAKRNALEKQLLKDPNLLWWIGLQKLQNKERFSPTEKALSLTAQHASDPFVREEIKKIVRNRALPIMVRQIANTIVKSEKENNLLLLHEDTRKSANGKQTVILPVLHGEWKLKIPAKKGKYLARVRITLPKNTIPAEKTWVNLRLQGRTKFNKPAGAFLDTPRITPQSGRSYTIMNTIQLDSRAEYISFIVNLFHFPDKSRVILSDMAILPLEK